MHYPPLKLVNRRVRERAKILIDSAPDGYVVSVREPTRSLDQNAKMWVMLGEISEAEPMGWKYTDTQWKQIVMNACGWEVQFLPDLNGGHFPGELRSSKLTTRQMSMLIEFMYAFGSEKGVVFREPEPEGMR